MVSLLECSLQSIDEIGADDVFEFLWLGPMIEAENLIMQPGLNVREKTERARRIVLTGFPRARKLGCPGTKACLSLGKVVSIDR